MEAEAGRGKGRRASARRRLAHIRLAAGDEEVLADGEFVTGCEEDPESSDASEHEHRRQDLPRLFRDERGDHTCLEVGGQRDGRLEVLLQHLGGHCVEWLVVGLSLLRVAVVVPIVPLAGRLVVVALDAAAAQIALIATVFLVGVLVHSCLDPFELGVVRTEGLIVHRNGIIVQCSHTADQRKLNS